MSDPILRAIHAIQDAESCVLGQSYPNASKIIQFHRQAILALMEARDNVKAEPVKPQPEWQKRMWEEAREPESIDPKKVA